MAFEHNGRMRPEEALRQLVGVFETRGWLDRTLRIKRCDRSYSISCSRNEFMVYRINDNWGIPPGLPGWPVCIVDSGLIVEDSELSEFGSDEPGAGDWLHYMASDDFEVMEETY